MLNSTPPAIETVVSVSAIAMFLVKRRGGPGISRPSGSSPELSGPSSLRLGWLHAELITRIIGQW